MIFKENPERHVFHRDRTHENKGVSEVLVIHSKHICQQLEKLGCSQAKTFKIVFPEWMPEHLHQHFIRGYFDGDGGISFQDKKNLTDVWSFKITGTKPLTVRIKEIIESKIDINLGIYPEKSVFSACCSGNRQIRTIMEWLYKDATIYLHRKYNLYLKLLKDIEEVNQKIEAGTQGFSKRYLDK